MPVSCQKIGKGGNLAKTAKAALLKIFDFALKKDAELFLSFKLG
jgi:hypothetical protein